jgi:hypothetical protein
MDSAILMSNEMTSEIPARELSSGKGGNDVARVHRTMQLLGRSVPAAEVSDRVMGAGTVAVTNALQAEFDLSATGVIDTATVRSINVRLANLTADQRVVRGRVRDTIGKPFSHGFMQIRPDVLTFPSAQSTGAIDWLGKGTPSQQEWVFRMDHAQSTGDPPRPNRTRF